MGFTSCVTKITAVWIAFRCSSISLHLALVVQVK
jgi:hypothetical protein